MNLMYFSMCINVLSKMSDFENLGSDFSEITMHQFSWRYCFHLLSVNKINYTVARKKILNPTLILSTFTITTVTVVVI